MSLSGSTSDGGLDRGTRLPPLSRARSSRPRRPNPPRQHRLRSQDPGVALPPKSRGGKLQTAARLQSSKAAAYPLMLVRSRKQLSTLCEIPPRPAPGIPSLTPQSRGHRETYKPFTHPGLYPAGECKVKSLLNTGRLAARLKCELCSTTVVNIGRDLGSWHPVQRPPARLSNFMCDVSKHCIARLRRQCRTACVRF